MDVLVEKIESLEQENQQAANSIVELQSEIESRKQVNRERMEGAGPATKVLWETFVTYWDVIMLIVIGIVLVCFFVTKGIIETRIRSRFHGIKIW